MKLFDRSRLRANRAALTRRPTTTGFRALGAYSNDGRDNATGAQVGETYRTQRERTQLIWNALELIDNSGLAESILGRLGQYVGGALSYQARTGDRALNQDVEDYLRDAFSSQIDITGRFSLREMLGIGVRGTTIKGGVGLQLVRPEPDSSELKLRGIEYDRIGNPYMQAVSREKVGGVHIDRLGREVAFDIYRRDRVGGMYSLEATVNKYAPGGEQQFMHVFRPGPGGFDGYKGRSAFATVIDYVHYMDEMKKFELQAQHWAASQSGVYYTESGELPRGVYETRQDTEGNTQRTFRVTPNTIQAVGKYEKLDMFKNERPHANVQAMWQNVVREICIATGLPYIFIYDEDGGGPGVRFAGNQADRTIREWWQMFDERMLRPVVRATLLNAAHIKGVLPWHPALTKGIFLGPKAPSIDTGYDSAAILNEMNEGVRTGAGVAASFGEDYEDIQDQREAEVQGVIERAQRIAQNTGVTFEVALSMMRRSQNAAQGIGGVAAQVEKDDPEREGATSNGVALP